MRDRFRAQVRDEIKRAALRQLAQAGPQGLSINAIAKELGVSGPALYRYFAGRDDLLTELIVDAYDDLADAVGAAVDGVADGVRARPPSVRSRARTAAGRSSSLTATGCCSPRPCRATTRTPSGSSTPPSEAMTTAARGRAQRPPGGRPARAPGGGSQPRLAAWSRARGREADPAVALHAAVTAWARLHGQIAWRSAGTSSRWGSMRRCSSRRSCRASWRDGAPARRTGRMRA